jgi:hypothetical protein
MKYPTTITQINQVTKQRSNNSRTHDDSIFWYGASGRWRGLGGWALLQPNKT